MTLVVRALIFTKRRLEDYCCALRINKQTSFVTPALTCSWQSLFDVRWTVNTLFSRWNSNLRYVKWRFFMVHELRKVALGSRLHCIAVMKKFEPVCSLVFNKENVPSSYTRIFWRFILKYTCLLNHFVVTHRLLSSDALTAFHQSQIALLSN